MTAPNVGYARLLDHAQEGYAPVLTGRALAIDVERAREVVGRLEAVADELRSEVERLAMIQVVPPGHDPVSRNAAAQSDRMIFASRAYLRSWHDDVVAGIDALRQQIADFVEADRRNAARL
ncbi:hypothetical protein [Pseudonocardia sp. WMMC193]|uniref:hypothetical protein n=1 Tax=Pseudonocardia sp. WMMC193 TaxID=2911965 RepID=UPI001F20C250|nr:hypothetical protein [Pseudonocardia sp. WMMC193]MCF7553321.1 hypothetical protein [Pseudonocardia sp. WMMC193]